MTLNNKKSKTTAFFSKFLTGTALAAILVACVNVSSGPKVDLSKPVKVALLVPSGGSNAEINAIGNSITAAAKMALADYNAGDIDLMIYQTGGNEGTAAAMAKKAQSEGAQFILGPLKSIEALSVMTATPDLPMMTFSNNSDVVGKNAYVFGTSFDVIATRIIKFAKSKGSKSIGVIASNDAGGTQGLVASQNAAKKNGVKVVYSSQYPLDVASIQANAPGIAAALKASGAQALMFTDTPNGGLGIMANALDAQGYTSKSAQYLGLARWDDNANFLNQAKLDGGYFAVPDLPKLAKFNARYQAATGSVAPNLAGLGYDGVAAVIQLMKNAKASGDTTPFGSNDIKGMSFNGVMGAFRFNKNNQAERALAIMQVSGSSAVMVSPAPASM